MIIKVDENHKNFVIKEWSNIFSKEFVDKDEDFSDSMLNSFLDKLYTSFSLALNSNIDYSLIKIPYLEYFSDRYFEKYVNQCVDSAVKLLGIESSKVLWNFKIYVFYNFYKELGKRLKKSIDKRQDLIDSIGGMLFIVNKNGDVVWYNKVFSDFVTSKFPNLSELKVIDEYFKDKIFGLFNKKEDEIDVFNLVFDFDEVNKKNVFKITATKLRENFIMVLGYDITNIYDAQEMEIKLKSNELKLKFLLDNDASPMFLLDENGAVINSNRFAKEFLSKFNSQNIYSENIKFWDIDVMADSKKELLDIFKKNRQSSLSECMDIGNITVYMRFSNIYDGNGVILGTLINVIEDENLVAVKNKYEEIKEVSEAIYEIVSEAIIVVENDEKYSVAYCNESAFKLIRDNNNLSDVKNNKIIKYIVNILNKDISDVEKVYLNSDINTEFNISRIKSLNKIVVMVKSLHPLVIDLKKNIEILDSNNKKLNSFEF